MFFCGLAIGRVIAPIGQRAELERYTRGFILVAEQGNLAELRGCGLAFYCL